MWVVLVLVFLIWYVQYQWKRRFLYKHAGKVPGPKGWPLIGNALDFAGDSNDVHDNLMKYLDYKPDLIKAWFGPKLFYFVTKPEYIGKVLTSQKSLSKMYLYKFGEPLSGHGLTTAPVPVWKRHRKIIMPTFNQTLLNGFVEIFSRQSTSLCEVLEKYVGKDFDVLDVTRECTLDIICEAAMGIKIHAQTNGSSIGPWMDRLMEIIFQRMVTIWYQIDFLFQWTKLYHEQTKIIKKFHAFVKSVIRAKQNNGSKPKRKAFLDLLLEASKDNKLTESEIRDEVTAFVVAGSDSQSTTLCFVFLMLALYPDIEQRVYDEVYEVLGDRMVEPEDLPLLTYTERVIKETMRLFPITPFLGREISEDLLLEDDLYLPEGASVVLGVIHVHRNPLYWENPLMFNPDRFLPQEVAKQHPYSYLPFSAGLRSCVGYKYALMAIKTILATTVRKYQFYTKYRSLEEVKVKTNVILRPRDGYQLKIALRR